MSPKHPTSFVHLQAIAGVLVTYSGHVGVDRRSCLHTALWRNRWPRRALGLILLAWYLLPAQARAAGACEQTINPLLHACTFSHGTGVTPYACPPGRIIVRASFSGLAHLDIELQPGAQHAFRTIRGIGISPVGEFSRWSEAPAPYQQVVDELTACIDTHAELLAPSASVAPSPTAAPGDAAVARTLPAYPIPWLALTGLLMGSACLALRRPKHPNIRQALLTGLTVIGGLVATWIMRTWATTPMYLHQNGQGPLWVEAALDDPLGLFRYGPGYGQLFAPLVRRLPSDPDTALLTGMALASLTIPVAAYTLARRVGASKLLAFVCAIWMACAPVPMRLAASESYFAIGLILIALAAALLSRGTHGTHLRSPRLWFHSITAGVIVSLVARIHPLLWIPAATITLGAWLQRGRARDRFKLSLVSALIIATVVVATSGKYMLAVLEGSLGQQWMPSTGGGLELVIPPPAFWLVALVLIALGWRRRTIRRSLELAVLGSLTGVVAWTTNLVSANQPWIADAFLWLFAPAWISLIVAALRDVRPRFAAGIGTLGVAIWCLVRIPKILVPTTDGLELNEARSWRAQLPPGSELIWLARAGERTLQLPLYTHFPVRRRPWTASDPVPKCSPSAETYFYASSLCSTPEGRDACSAFQERHTLEQVASWELPAVASLPWLPLAQEPIPAALYRVETPKPDDKHAHTPVPEMTAPQPPSFPRPTPAPVPDPVFDPKSPVKADEQVVLFPSLASLGADGQHWHIPVHGWIFEWEDDDLLRNAALAPLSELLDDDPTNQAMAIERARWFLVDNERGKQITVAIAGHRITADRSAADGHFMVSIDLPRESLHIPEMGGLLMMRVVTRPGDERIFKAPIFFVPPRATLVISDIDDTVKDSRVTDKQELLRRTFLKAFTPVPGMPEFVASLRPPDGHLHLVSASPWQLYPHLQAFLDQQQLAHTSFSLKRIRLKDNSLLKLFEDPLTSKVASIEALLTRFPQAPVILVGDSGEQDPEVYGELARRHPAQIRHIYIRLAPGGPMDEQRKANAFAELDPSLWEVFDTPPS